MQFYAFRFPLLICGGFGLWVSASSEKFLSVNAIKTNLNMCVYTVLKEWGTKDVYLQHDIAHPEEKMSYSDRV